MNVWNAQRSIRRAVAATPLRIKLVATVLVLATIGLGLAATATTASLHSYLINRVDSQLQSFARGPASGGGFAFRDGGGPQSSGPTVNGSPGGATTGGGSSGVTTTPGDGRPDLPSQFYVVRFGPNGEQDATYSAPLSSQSPPVLPRLTTARGTALSSHTFTVPSQDGKSSWRVLTLVAPDGSTVAVASSLSDVDHTVNHVILLEIGIGLAALVLIGFAGYLVIDRSLRPLVSVETTAAAIAAGDLTQRVPALPVRTEVGRLSAALNTMLSQIETAFSHERDSQQRAKASEERMRRFVADASHELRTPLTSIRGFAELYRMGATTEEMDLAHLMNRIETEAARMGIMVEDLLLLARLDQQRPLENEPVDLLVVATDVVNDARVVAADRAINLSTETRQPPIVSGDESRLRQVLHNLMTNAITHTPAGTPVDVTLRTTNGSAPTAVVEVADRGPGMTDEQRVRVFERFYRVDSSRNRGAGGTGLGLSIVSGLVEAHHGNVTVTAREGGGAVFTVTMPLAT